jgi:hypothetical protein
LTTHLVVIKQLLTDLVVIKQLLTDLVVIKQLLTLRAPSCRMIRRNDAAGRAGGVRGGFFRVGRVSARTLGMDRPVRAHLARRFAAALSGRPARAMARATVDPLAAAARAQRDDEPDHDQDR